MMGCVYRDSCRELFKGLKILPLALQYIFSLLLCVFNNGDYFVSNNAHHSNNTRQRNDLHLPRVTLSMYQKAVYYSGIKVFSALPKATEDISSKPNKFKIALKRFLYAHLFYTLDEFFNNQ
jgi:hypothetical protein